MVERGPLEALEQHAQGAGDVVVLLLLDRALVVGLRPAALVVLAVDVVLDAVGLLEAVGAAEEQPRGAAGDQQHPPAARRAGGGPRAARRGGGGGGRRGG